MSQAGLVSWAGSVCRDLGTSLKHKKSTSRLHDNRASPVSGDPGSQLTGLKIFHVIAFTGPARGRGLTPGTLSQTWWHAQQHSSGILEWWMTFSVPSHNLKVICSYGLGEFGFVDMWGLRCSQRSSNSDLVMQKLFFQSSFSDMPLIMFCHHLSVLPSLTYVPRCF